MNKENCTDSNNISTKRVMWVLGLFIVTVVGFYFVNFNLDFLENGAWLGVFKNISNDTGDWGTFGDYIGGLLNPAIAAFAFYLIAKTYELQKKELEATRRLLKISTDAQEQQIELAALTALLSSNLTRIDILKVEQQRLLYEVLPENPTKLTNLENIDINSMTIAQAKGLAIEVYANDKEYVKSATEKIIDIKYNIKNLTGKNSDYEKKIKNFCNEKS